MKIYTRGGDDGTTGLYGGKRLKKNNARLHTYGSVDELNACLGIVRTRDIPKDIDDELMHIQERLFVLGADLATPVDTKIGVPRIAAADTKELEEWIDAHTEHLAPLNAFILPGGSVPAAELHLARTICRRAERWCVELAEHEAINNDAIVYINRLSDYLFTIARSANQSLGITDIPVSPRKKSSNP